MYVIGYFANKALVKVLDLPEAIITAYVVLCCLLGAFAARSNVNDVWLMGAFGSPGYAFECCRFPITPIMLGVILGPPADTNFMTTKISLGNDWIVLFTRPVTGALMAITIFTLLLPLWRYLHRRRPAVRATLAE